MNALFLSCVKLTQLLSIDDRVHANANYIQANIVSVVIIFKNTKSKFLHFHFSRFWQCSKGSVMLVSSLPLFHSSTHTAL